MAGKPKFLVRPGDRFGRGTVLGETRIPDRRGKTARWVRLQCECGTLYEVRIGDLFKPDNPTRSCGCLRREVASATMSRPENLARLAKYARSPEGREKSVATNKATKTTHGLSRSAPLYSTWSGMMTRCYNPNFTQFKDYGGRGIAVCERWHNPQLFIQDIERLIGPRPPGLTLDRWPDNDGNYEPGNVRWATWEEQVRNSRRYISSGPKVAKQISKKPPADGTRKGALYTAWWRLLEDRPDEVCPAWHDWTVFRSDVERLIGPRPEGRRFYRVDEQRPYEPGNVAWVTGAEQIKRAQTARWGESRPEPKHGLFEHPLYRPWKNMMNRCFNPADKNYYGDLGITVYEPWREVGTFIKEIEQLLGPKPAGAVFRRIDPDGSYIPGNVCWGKAGRPPRR